MLDLDHFKLLNDSQGHQAGDVALREVARCLSETSRKTDLTGRYGGEEIVIGLLGANSKDAKRIAENLRLKIEDKFFQHHNSHIEITASFGTASLDKKMDTNQLIDAADKALYKAKKGGRNRVESAS